MEHFLDLRGMEKYQARELPEKFCGKDPAGNELRFNNCCMTINGKPCFMASGECHFSRVDESQWEDTLQKMKMGGVNVLSTYIFWIYHEEEEGKFCFEGRRNLRKFVQLCKKHGMYVIVRIGPFSHGEARNGGLPDWLYGKDFEVRSLDEGFLYYTRRFYRAVAGQLDGLYYKDGGPVIGTQIENEYMHSGAPWEQTTGVSDEWVPAGEDGDSYMKTLKRIAREEGIMTPFYTATAWGKAAAPVDELLPLWGGYAYWPWIFYNYKGEHPVTPEYIYRDNHNNSVGRTYNFEPEYQPESVPYMCCEMGGGMSCYYNYRFQLSYESVDAMANIKIAGGCNFLGYYMYRGGSHLKGKKTPFLNEFQCPKISYDYQAAIGEAGQLRPSYFRLKALHLFARNFQEELCYLRTALPEGSQDIKPEDTETLRYAVRTDGEKGFLFINNFQDHVQCRPKKNETILLRTRKKDLEITGLSLAAGEEAVLPFGLEFDGLRLDYAAVQPLSVIKEDRKTTCFFFIPEGMKPLYVWEGKQIRVPEDEMSVYHLQGKTGDVEIVTLTRGQSLHFYEAEIKGRKTAVLSSTAFTCDEDVVRLERQNGEEEMTLMAYPCVKLCMEDEEAYRITELKAEPFQGIRAEPESSVCPDSQDVSPRSNVMKLEAAQAGKYRYRVKLPQKLPEGKRHLLRISYTGDIGQAFLDGEMISDNFCNGAVWEIGLDEHIKEAGGEKGRTVTILITPLKENREIDVSSTMAGRREQEGNATAKIQEVSLAAIQETVVRIK